MQYSEFIAQKTTYARSISTYTQVMPHDGGSNIGDKESAYGDPGKEPYPSPPLKGGCFY